MKKTMMILALMATLPLALFAEDDKPVQITIPSTGHLAIKPERNFKGPAGVIVSNYTGSGNATSKGLVFNNQELGEGVVIAHAANSSSGLILTAQPGTYTITYTDDTATKQFFSTNVSWTDESVASTTKDETRIYKFVNRDDKIGFERDETYASTLYKSCTMGEGEHVYFAIGKKPMERISATLNTTVEELAFIPWSEIWGCPMIDPAGITEVVNGKSDNSKLYDLQGREVTEPAKGLYIKNGKKYIAK